MSKTRFRRATGALACAALLAGAVGVAAAKPAMVDYKAAKWLLLRTFEPTPTPQRGLDFWVLSADVEAARVSKAKTKDVRMLIRRSWQAPGVAGAWEVITTRFFCDQGEYEDLRREAFHRGAPPKTEKMNEGRKTLMPHGPNGFVYGWACYGDRADAPVAEGLEDVFRQEAEADRAFADAQGR